MKGKKTTVTECYTLLREKIILSFFAAPLRFLPSPSLDTESGTMAKRSRNKPEIVPKQQPEHSAQPLQHHRSRSSVLLSPPIPTLLARFAIFRLVLIFETVPVFK